MLRLQQSQSILNVGVPLFDISSTQSSPKRIAWQTSDGQADTDISEIILGINTDDIVIKDAINALQKTQKFLLLRAI